MANTKKFTSNTSRDYYAVLTLTEGDQSVTDNDTEVSYKLVMYSGDYNFSGYTIGYQVYINGEKVAYHTNSGKQTSLGTNSSKTVCSGKTTVKHKDDGTKTLSVSFKIFMDKTSFLPANDLTAEGTMKLTTIPRATVPSIDLDSVEMGKSIVISMPRKASAFTHTLTYSFAGMTGTIGTDLGTSKTWTVPKAETLASAIPNATSGTMTITCKTYNGSSLVGTKTDTVKVTVPSSVEPSIDDVDITEAVAAVTEAFGDIFLQNLSQLNVSVDASGIYGSTIKSYSVTLDGVTYIQQAFTSNVIRTAGTLAIAVEITDSRGRKKSETYEISVVEYESPTITSMTYMHCNEEGKQDSDGTYMKIIIAGRVHSVNEQNTKALKLKYKSMTGEGYKESPINLTDWTFRTEVIVGDTDPTVTYEYIAELTDKLNAASPEVYRIATGVIVLSRLAGGKGVTLFEEATAAGFRVGGEMPSTFTGDVFFNHAAQVRSNLMKKSLWNDGGWVGGSIEVEGMQDYIMFLIRMSGQGTVIPAYKETDVNGVTWIRGIGGYVSDTTTDFTYQFNATLDGNSLTLVNCDYLWHGSGSTHGTRVLCGEDTFAISEIIGVL